MTSKDDPDVCESHDWELGYNSGIDLCRSCPAKRFVGPSPGEYVIEYTQQGPPYGYSGWSK